jgi:hypothetical protein
MERAVKILFFFSIAMVVLHYIGPATQLVMAQAPDIIDFVVSMGTGLW